jgi:hydrogenase large subunit
MAQLITVDPVTRIEGHLRIDVEVENGVVKDAWSSGTMFRGFEMLLRGKHPWDAQQVTERICGVCPVSHGVAASYNLDSAMGVELPDNARLMRSLILGSNFIQSHVLHFYHLAALDYVDVTAVANYSGNDPALNALKAKIVSLVKAGDVYPFLPRYESGDYVSDPELATVLVGHYVQALEMRKKAHEMMALFAGRGGEGFVGVIPGGVTVHPNISNIADFRARLKELRFWIDNVYVQDIVTIAQVPEYAPFFTLGDSGGNYLAYGCFDENSDGTDKFLPRGYIMGSDVAGVKEVDPDKITESVKYSWYTEDCEGRHPSDGKTEPDVHKKDAYSFLKAPRYDGHPMEVGPMARMLVMAGLELTGKRPEKLMGLIKSLGLDTAVNELVAQGKFGILPRHAMRALECKLVADQMDVWLDELQENIGGKIWDSKAKDIPGSSQGMGLVEAPRGALGHWINIAGKKIENYQCVVPTTWNASPRDKNGNRGPIETALIGLPVPDPENPINLVRCVRSFDPCLACAIHVIHPEHNGVKEFRVV